MTVLRGLTFDLLWVRLTGLYCIFTGFVAHYGSLADDRRMTGGLIGFIVIYLWVTVGYFGLTGGLLWVDCVGLTGGFRLTLGLILYFLNLHSI